MLALYISKQFEELTIPMARLERKGVLDSIFYWEIKIHNYYTEHKMNKYHEWSISWIPEEKSKNLKV